MTLPQILERLDELEKVCEGATEAFWTMHRQKHCMRMNCHEIEIRDSYGGALFRSTSYGSMEADGKFIAQSRTALPAAVKGLRAALDKLSQIEDLSPIRERERRDLCREAFTEIATILEGL